jgi:hypothetical protein
MKQEEMPSSMGFRWENFEDYALHDTGVDGSKIKRLLKNGGTDID